MNLPQAILKTNTAISTPSQASQKLQIIHYVSPTSNIYYTLCQKQGETISIISHARLIVYNEANSLIYYVNQLPKQQNKIEAHLNKPKKQSIVINSVEFKNQSKSKILSVVFNKIGDKGAVSVVEWKFLMESEKVAVDWVKFVKSKKQEKTVKALEQYKKSQPADKNSPKNQPMINNNNNNIDNNSNLNNSNINKNTNNNYLNPQSNIQTSTVKQPSASNLNTSTNQNANNLNRSSLLNSPQKQKQKQIQKQAQQNLLQSQNRNQNVNRQTTPSKLTYSNNLQQQPPYNRSSILDSKINNTQNKPQQKTITTKQKQPNINQSRQPQQPPIRNTSSINNSTYGNYSKIGQNKPISKPIQTTQPTQNKQYNRSSKYTYTQPLNQTINKSKIQESKINQTRGAGKYNLSSNVNANQNISNQYRQNPQNIGRQSSKPIKKMQPVQTNKYNSNQISKNKLPAAQKITDWNLQFLTKHNQQTLHLFSTYCLQIFKSLDPTSITLSQYPSSRQSNKMNPKKYNEIITVVKNNIVFQFATDRTKVSQKLKHQYNNYHYIVQCCKSSRLVNVPLCCMIQYLGFVCLAKVDIKYGGDGSMDGEIIGFGDNRARTSQKDRDIGQQLKMLEMFTKISSEIIKKQAVVVNMTKVYGKQGNNYCIYIDNLYNYLPCHPQNPQLQIRPQLIIDNISSTLSQQQHSRLQIQYALNQSFKQLCQLLSQQQVVVVSYFDLKNIVHSYGLTLAILPQLYSKISSRNTKRYIYTALLCNILKQEITTSIIDLRQNGQSSAVVQSVEEALRIYCQIGLNTQYEQIWKNIEKQFKKKYKMNFTVQQVEGAFFMSTMMEMLVGQYDLRKLDRNKKYFQQVGIILQGFMVCLNPKIKCYGRFMSEVGQRVVAQCRATNHSINQMIALLPQSEQQILFRFMSLSPQVREQIILHLSKHIPPKSSTNHSTNTNAKTYLLQSIIYNQQNLNKQPPINFTHQLTINYANYCRKLGLYQDYKTTIQKSVDILAYWLGQDCVLLCDVYQSLAEYYGSRGNREDCINFMKQALTTCIRSMGTHSAKVGQQYHKLAQKQLKYGDASEAHQNYLKAKQNLQSQIAPSPVYPITLFKLATLSLQMSNPQKAILYCIQSLKQSQQTPLPQQSQLNIYEVLSRAYQITHSKQQLKNLAHLVAKVFNNTSDIVILEQMVRICLVGFIFTMEPIKQQKIQQYLAISGISSASNSNNTTQSQRSKLMRIAQRYVLMEKWIKDIQNIDRFISQAKSRRVLSNQGKQFMQMFAAIAKIVGIQFLQGVLNQSKYY